MEDETPVRMQARGDDIAMEVMAAERKVWQRRANREWRRTAEFEEAFERILLHSEDPVRVREIAAAALAA